MSWPKGRARPKKVGASGPSDPPAEFADALKHEAALSYDAAEEAAAHEALGLREPNQPPADWRKGALLNVRNRGDAYVITLYPEEFSDEHPERALRFTNLGECQDFVSKWYAAEHHDPRAR